MRVILLFINQVRNKLEARTSKTTHESTSINHHCRINSGFQISIFGLAQNFCKVNPAKPHGTRFLSETPDCLGRTHIRVTNEVYFLLNEEVPRLWTGMGTFGGMAVRSRHPQVQDGSASLLSFTAPYFRDSVLGSRGSTAIFLEKSSI